LFFVGIVSFTLAGVTALRYFRKFAGKVSVNVDPCPSLLSTLNVPLSIVVSRRHIDKPRPVPP
jgi:hypothetical protein